jgi:fibrillarin-like pre-rRNA processing protein
MVEITPHGLPGVFTDGRSIYTVNLVPGQSVYGEKLEPHLDVQYRAWNPKRSKLAAFILKRCKTFPFKEDSTVLYLGAATGTTASHVSDVVSDGTIFCVEISPPPFRKLVALCETRQNMMPIMADAHSPETYEHLVDTVDIIYMDIAQKHQADIFLKNLRLLKDGGTAYLMVKARSIDVSKDPKVVYEAVKEELSEAGLKILESSELLPYEKDHMAIVSIFSK